MLHTLGVLNVIPRQFYRQNKRVERQVNNPMYVLINLAKCIESLFSNPDRLPKLKYTLQDPSRLPSISRNERMAREIARIMDIDIEDADDKVRTASVLRGKHSHRLSANQANWKRMEYSEMFLREALQAYLAQ